MKTSRNSFANDRAFTKIELMVVILAIAMLAGVVTSATRGTKNQIKIAQCAGNLRQFALSQLLYAADNSDKLPAPASPNGNWAWDLDWNVGNFLNQYGTPPEAMYCPGTAPRFQPANNEELYEYYAPGTVHVIGYVPTLPGNPSIPSTNVNSTLTPQPVSIGPLTILPARPFQRVLIADATLTMAPSGNYYDIAGGYRIHHTSPHLDGFIPAGGNVAMLDGHVEWRPFSQMQGRTVSVVNGLPVPVFLW
jgi:prepilin-type processing-associated H-X9-DG protein